MCVESIPFMSIGIVWNKYINNENKEYQKPHRFHALEELDKAHSRYEHKEDEQNQKRCTD